MCDTRAGFRGRGSEGSAVFIGPMPLGVVYKGRSPGAPGAEFVSPPPIGGLIAGISAGRSTEFGRQPASRQGPTQRRSESLVPDDPPRLPHARETSGVRHDHPADSGPAPSFCPGQLSRRPKPRPTDQSYEGEDVLAPPGSRAWLPPVEANGPGRGTCRLGPAPGTLLPRRPCRRTGDPGGPNPMPRHAARDGMRGFARRRRGGAGVVGGLATGMARERFRSPRRSRLLLRPGGDLAPRDGRRGGHLEDQQQTGDRTLLYPSREVAAGLFGRADLDLLHFECHGTPTSLQIDHPFGEPCDVRSLQTADGPCTYFFLGCQVGAHIEAVAPVFVRRGARAAIGSYCKFLSGGDSGEVATSAFYDELYQGLLRGVRSPKSSRPGGEPPGPTGSITAGAWLPVRAGPVIFSDETIRARTARTASSNTRARRCTSALPFSSVFSINLATSTKTLSFQRAPGSGRVSRGPRVRPSASRAEGVGLQWVRFPPGNWVAPAGSYRSGGGGNETVGAFETDGPLGGSASRQAVTRVNVEQASKDQCGSRPAHDGEGRRRWGEGRRLNRPSHERSEPSGPPG